MFYDIEFSGGSEDRLRVGEIVSSINISIRGHLQGRNWKTIITFFFFSFFGLYFRILKKLASLIVDTEREIPIANGVLDGQFFFRLLS